MLSDFRKRIRQIGPAFILAAVVLGPGSVTLATIAGSRYGYQLLWVPVVSTVFMVVFTVMAARIALVSRQSLFDVARRKYGATIATWGGVFGFLSILAFQAGNSAAVGFAGNALFGMDARLWSIGFLFPALALLFLPDLYRKLEILVKVVIGLMIVGFAGTLVTVGIDFSGAFRGLVPSFPDNDAVFLSLGMAATTFSIAAAAYQSYLMKEKRWGPDELSTEGLDSLVGIGILGGISVVILLVSAGVIRQVAEPVFDAQTMARQLEPVAGPAAFILFTVGFFFAGFSSLVVNPLVGATLLVDGIGREPDLKNRPLRLSAAGILIFGTFVAVLFGGTPIELLRVAQALAVVAFPVLGFLVWRLSADRKIMGENANSLGLNILAGLGYLTVLGIALSYVRQILSWIW
ncbi:MAG: Nramp family divalent metal transporter [Acidobacteriota bacterium]|nr:MAG: Nramp family divalent metal transporter [Acidobacteriota bacterium]